MTAAQPTASAWWETIPDELKELDQWTCWKYENRKGTATKLPCNTNGIEHDVAKHPPSESFATVLAGFTTNRCGNLSGIGFIFTENDPYAGVDLDDCIVDGKLSPKAEEILSRFNTYAEISPSGNGVKIFMRGKLPGLRNRTGDVEMYDRKRFFTTTGNLIPGKPRTVNECQCALTAFYNATFVEKKKPAEEQKPFAVRMTKLEHLMAGDLKAAGFDPEKQLSEAVQSLLVLLFEKYSDREFVEFKFKQSCLYTQTHWREKWERLRVNELNVASQFSAETHATTQDWPEVAETLRNINKRFCVVENFGGKCRVCSEEPDPDLPSSFKFTHQSFEDFRNRFMHQLIKVGEDKHGAVYQDRGSVWLNHKDRRQYNQIVYAPGQTLSADVHNLWRGFAYAAKEGDCSLYLQHLRENICQGEKERYNWLIGWMAYAVRHPNEPGHTCPVLVGGQGTGKNSTADPFANLWGAHALTVTQKSQFTGHFNAHLRACSVLIVNEAFYAGDRSQAGPMKALITDPFLAIEAKGVDITRTRNLLHIIIISNEDWVVPGDIDSRRFTVLRSSDAHKEDAAYFAAIHEQLNNGGYEALLYHLLNEVDLSNFNPRQILDTEELHEQKAFSLHGIDGVWHECLQRGCLPGKINEDKTATLRGSDLIDWAAKKHQRGWDSLRTEHVGYLFGVNPRGKRKGMEFQKDQATDLFEKGRVRVWIIPTLAVARAAWDEKRFKGDWGEEGHWHVDKDWAVDWKPANEKKK